MLAPVRPQCKKTSEFCSEPCTNGTVCNAAGRSCDRPCTSDADCPASETLPYNTWCSAGHCSDDTCYTLGPNNAKVPGCAAGQVCREFSTLYRYCVDTACFPECSPGRVCNAATKTCEARCGDK